MDKKIFYNRFHNNSTIQFKLITINNYTYATTLNIVNKLISDTNNLNILDFGCGVGTIDFYLANKGNNILGTDISPDAIRIANQTAKNLHLENNIRFTTLDILNEYKNDKFDLILCNEVLEHLENDLETLILLKKLLKKNGKIMVSVPSLSAPLYKMGLTTDFDKRVGHLRRYDELTITNLLTNAGYHIEQITKNEGIIRNSFFVIKPFGVFLKLVKGPLVQVLNVIDNISMVIWGESDIAVIASNK